MSDRRRPSFDWALWLQWILCTTLAWILGSLLPQAFALFAGGVVIGVLQWTVLRQRIGHAGWWIVASAVGWAAGWVLVIAMIPPEFGILTGTVLGAAMGILQWFILRRLVRQATWWIVVSVLGWTVALTGFMGNLLIGGVVGALTGTALELLLRYPGLMKSEG